MRRDQSPQVEEATAPLTATQCDTHAEWQWCTVCGHQPGPHWSALAARAPANQSCPLIPPPQKEGACVFGVFVVAGYKEYDITVRVKLEGNRSWFTRLQGAQGKCKKKNPAGTAQGLSVKGTFLSTHVRTENEPRSARCKYPAFQFSSSDHSSSRNISTLHFTRNTTNAFSNTAFIWIFLICPDS